MTKRNTVSEAKPPLVIPEAPSARSLDIERDNGNIPSGAVAAAVSIPPSEPTRTQSRSRLRGVDGFRALGATSILLYHVWLYSSPTGRPLELGPFSRFVFPHLPVGVTLFFTLSGFLLYRPLVACALNGRPLPGLRNYFRNRSLRILPAYWVVLLAAGVLLPAVAVRISPLEVELGRLVGHPTMLLSNVALMQNYFAGSLDSGIGPTWSLAVEVVFYLVLPFLGILAAVTAARAMTRRGKTVATLVPVGLLFAIGLLTAWTTSSIVAPGSGTWHSVLVRSFLNHADLFAFGMGVAVLMVNLEDGFLKLPSWWRKVTAGILGVLVLATIILVDRGLILTYRGAVPYEGLTALASALLLALVVLPSADSSVSILTRVLESRVFVAAGLFSYGLFLWHEPLVRWSQGIGLTFAGTIGFLLNLVLLGALSAVLAMLTYRFVERPALARKRSVRTSPR